MTTLAYGLLAAAVAGTIIAASTAAYLLVLSF